MYIYIYIYIKDWLYIVFTGLIFSVLYIWMIFCCVILSGLCWIIEIWVYHIVLVLLIYFIYCWLAVQNWYYLSVIICLTFLYKILNRYMAFLDYRHRMLKFLDLKMVLYINFSNWIIVIIWKYKHKNFESICYFM